MALRNNDKLDPLDRLIVKTVLENTIDQLAIVSGTIQHGLTLPQNQLQGPSTSSNVVHWNTTDKSLEEILLKEHKERTIAKKAGNGGNQEKTEQVESLRLLVSEANFTQNVLEESLYDVLNDGSYDGIVDSVMKSRKRNKEKSAIGEAERQAKEVVNTLKESIEVAKVKAETDTSSASMMIAKLKDELLESRRVTKGEEIFVKQLESVREEEETAATEKAEVEMEEEKNRLTIELENEQRVTLEVEHWLRDRHKFLSHLHEEWTNRLRDEVAAKEAELQALIAARNADKKRMKDAKQKTAEAKKFVEEQVAERERARAAKEKMKVQITKAIKIQAWWRMTMVKKCLGPYRKRKKQVQAAQAAAQAALGGKKRK